MGTSLCEMVVFFDVSMQQPGTGDQGTPTRELQSL
jgi:hypothetical protein